MANGMQQEPATSTSTAKKERVVISVAMKDGRTVEFGEKQKVQKTWVDIEGKETSDNPSAVRFDFSNGETRTVATDTGGLKDYFAAHGVSQKYGDEGAGSENVEDFIYAFDELDEQLAKGEWRAEREGGGFSGISVLAKALMEFSKQSADDVRAFLKPLKTKEKLGLRASKELKPIIDRLEADKAGDVNASALLSRFGAQT